MSDKPNRNSKKPGELSGFASPACLAHEVRRTQDLDEKAQVRENLKAWRKQQRTRLLALRDELNDDQHAVLSHLVAEQLQHSTWLDRDQPISFFWPMQGEIDLRPLITQLVERGVNAALPVIVQKNQPLEFWQWLPGEALSEDGLWGIPVPAVRRPVTPGILLVPMLGFDNEGHRLGFGGGYYDRTIAGMRSPPICIGVCGEFGHMQSIYPQSHDMPMHAIASESQFRIFSDPDNR